MSEHPTGRESLLGFLRSTKDEAERFNGKEIKEKWLADLRALMDTLLSYLAPAVQQRLLEVSQIKTTIREDQQLGEYEAPALRIIAPNQREVLVQARGRFIIGGQGRVDLGSGPKAAMLIRTTPGPWTFQRRANGPKAWDSASLTEDTFSEVVQDLLS